MSSLSIEQIIEQLDIRPFLETQGSIKFQKSTKNGTQFYCRCPFCSADKKLWVAVAGDKKGGWKCYSCEEKGGIVGLVVKLKNCSKGEAVKLMKAAAGIIDDRLKPVPPKVEKSPKKKLQNDIPVNSSAEPGEELSGKDDNSGGGPSEEMASASIYSGHSEELSMAAGEELSGEAETKPVTARGADGETAGSGEELSRSGDSSESKSTRPRDIYTRFVEVATLTDAHRAEFRTKRGFTEAIVNELQFRSGGPQNEAIIEQLRDEFSDQDLTRAGLLVEVNGVLIYNGQLLEDRVLIPYLDEQGAVYHLRPHKLGFKGIPIEPYCKHLLGNQNFEVVLTEGEFKAAALFQCGIPVVAIPGITSFGDIHFDRLVEMFRDSGVKRITVIFDNEIKDNPALPNYKEKPEDRYDTQLWSYLMGYKLYRAGFTARVGFLPDSWRGENGKTDWDGALAAGHTREEFLAVIEAAVTPKEFIEQNLPDDAKRIVRRKITRHFSNNPVKRQFNKYVISRNNRGEAWEETISNFVINIRSSFFTSEGVIRNVQLVNEYNETSEIFSLTPNDMAGLNEFKKFAFSKGNYVFKGNTTDLLLIWESEFMRDTGDLVFKPDRIGYIGSGVWLFGGLAVKEGKTYEPDNDGIFWINGKGYKPESIQLNSRGEAVEDAIPTLSKQPLDLELIADRLKETVGGYEAYIAIGWVIAVIFRKDIYEKYKSMPILFAHGKRESGKSTFMRWVMAFLGLETEGVGIAETTQNYIARALSYYSSLGCWFDEYRNELKVTQKDGYFRSAYDGHSAGKGTATAFQTRGFNVRAAVAMSGEELPRDNGLFTRLIPLQISAYKRSRVWYDWFNRHTRKLSYLAYYLITNYETLKPKILDAAAELKEALIQLDISDRTAQNWGICAGAFSAVIKKDPEFIQWVLKACQDIKLTGESEHMLNQFLTDLSILVSDEEIGEKHIKVENGKLSIWLSGAYNVWAKHYRSRTGKEPFDEPSIRKYLQEEPYYFKTDRVRLDKVARRVVILDIKKAPDAVAEIAENLGGWPEYQQEIGETNNVRKDFDN